LINLLTYFITGAKQEQSRSKAGAKQEQSRIKAGATRNQQEEQSSKE
jgi:hypothetical protein